MNLDCAIAEDVRAAHSAVYSVIVAEGTVPEDIGTTQIARHTVVVTDRLIPEDIGSAYGSICLSVYAFCE